MTRAADPRTDVAAVLLALGRPAPWHVLARNGGVLVDADGKPVMMAMPDLPAGPAHDLVQIVAAAINAACGVPEPPVEAPLDPRYLDARALESEKVGRGRPRQAAE